MDKHFTARENLQILLEVEWMKYKKAVANNKSFEEVKIIYLRIKKLQSQISEITEEIHRQLKIGD